MVAEEGVAGVAMHALARRAQTSIGSLYHFFPDRECVLRALVERHLAATAGISRDLVAVPAGVWRELSAVEAIDRLLAPFAKYLYRHADYLPLMNGREPSESDANFIHATRHMLAARLEAVGSAQREHYAAMVHAIAAGTIYVAFQTDPGRIGAYLGEVQRVLGAYLSDIEAAARTKPRGRKSA
ncbi:TetR family transcriptional regulator [Burkholderia sp. WAC0059]|nr:TetR family transcriptional regulator [Burkholderia sp. WAC0059]